MNPEIRRRLGLDNYTASVDLCNACRQFYVSRQIATEKLQKELESDSQEPCNLDGTNSNLIYNSNNNNAKCNSSIFGGHEKKKESGSVAYERGDMTTKNVVANDKRTPNCDNTGDNAININHTGFQHSVSVLKTEMLALMQQDLSLMKQLLILNDAIEELKSSQQRFSTSMSNTTSCSDFSDSDIFDSEIELSRSCSPSVSSAFDNASDLSSIIQQYDMLLQSGIKTKSLPPLSPLASRAISNSLTVPKDTHSLNSNSFDSGIQVDDDVN